MKKINIGIISFFVFMVVGCATPYQKDGFAGGYEETQLNENIWMVAVGVNGYSSKQRAIDFTLLRSAEICVENNYKYFMVVGSDTDINTTMGMTKGTTTTRDNGNGTFTSTTSGGIPFTISKPSANNTILLLNEKPDNSIYFDPSYVIRNIKEKYGIE